MSLGTVTEFLIELITKQVDDNSLVVWYDPEEVYQSVLPHLASSGVEIFLYTGSFIQLRAAIDQKQLIDGEEPPRMVVYVPLAQEKTHHALIELESAGVIMQPGQQPPARNTRLALVARNALRGVLGEDIAAHVEKQTDAGKLTLADLNALADKGGEISKGVVALIFGTGNPQEVALSFLDSDQLDESIVKKDATDELKALLRSEFGLESQNDTKLNDLRQNLARHVLMTEFISALGDSIPNELTSVPIASSHAAISSCASLSRTWRMRRDLRDSYVAIANRVERDLNLAALTIEPQKLIEIETFPSGEKALLRYAENRLLEESDGGVLNLAESRISRFWCEAEPTLQARWALVSSVAEVLLEADRVTNELNQAPATVSGLVEKYAGEFEPWCLLDTHHRHLESRWYNFEPLGNDYDTIEKLVIKARRRYVAVGSEIAEKFLAAVQQNPDNQEIPHQRETYERHIKPFLSEKKTAYIWVDALRYEMGKELVRLLREDFAVDLYSAMAAAPTITEIGMAALLPGAKENSAVVSMGSGKLAMQIGGTTIKDRKDRVAFLKKQVDVEFYDTKLDSLLPKPLKKVREGIENAQLILVTSQEIDELCEQGNIAQARRQMDGILNDLRRGVRVLFDLGIEQIILAADHGHIFADELTEDMKIDAPGGETADLHRRVWVGHGGNADDAFLRLPLASLGMGSDFDLATPWTFACFKSKGGASAYFHGGLSPQEVLIPVMNINPSSKASASYASGISWTLVPGSEKITTRFFSVQVSGFNTGLFDVTPPKVRIELRAKGKVVSRSVSASYGFEEAGDVALKNDEENSKQILPNTITAMITEDIDQKNVGLYLLDASTGAELSRLEKIEVNIAI